MVYITVFIIYRLPIATYNITGIAEGIQTMGEKRVGQPNVTLVFTNDMNGIVSLKDAYLKIGIAEDVIEIVPFNSLTLNTKEENPIVDESVTARNALISLERDTALINKDLEVEVPDVGADSIE